MREKIDTPVKESHSSESYKNLCQDMSLMRRDLEKQK